MQHWVQELQHGLEYPARPEATLLWRLTVVQRAPPTSAAMHETSSIMRNVEKLLMSWPDIPEVGTTEAVIPLCLTAVSLGLLGAIVPPGPICENHNREDQRVLRRCRGGSYLVKQRIHSVVHLQKHCAVCSIVEYFLGWSERDLGEQRGTGAPCSCGCALLNRTAHVQRDGSKGIRSVVCAVEIFLTNCSQFRLHLLKTQYYFEASPN